MPKAAMRPLGALIEVKKYNNTSVYLLKSYGLRRGVRGDASEASVPPSSLCVIISVNKHDKYEGERCSGRFGPRRGVSRPPQTNSAHTGHWRLSAIFASYWRSNGDGSEKRRNSEHHVAAQHTGRGNCGAQPSAGRVQHKCRGRGESALTAHLCAGQLDAARSRLAAQRRHGHIRAHAACLHNTRPGAHSARQKRRFVRCFMFLSTPHL